MITEKQQRFAEEYLVDLNATQAAIRAGYSVRTAKQQGARLLTNADVAAAITEGRKRQQERTEITATRVAQEMARIEFGDIRQLFHEHGPLRPIPALVEASAAASVEPKHCVEGKSGE